MTYTFDPSSVNHVTDPYRIRSIDGILKHDSSVYLVNNHADAWLKVMHLCWSLSLNELILLGFIRSMALGCMTNNSVTLYVIDQKDPFRSWLASSRWMHNSSLRSVCIIPTDNFRIHAINSFLLEGLIPPSCLQSLIERIIFVFVSWIAFGIMTDLISFSRRQSFI